MGIVIKQSIRSSIFAYIGVIIGALNFLYFFPKFLSPDQVGLIRVIPSAAFLMATFAQLGLSSSMIRFYPEMSKERRNTLYAQWSKAVRKSMGWLDKVS